MTKRINCAYTRYRYYNKLIILYIKFKFKCEMNTYLRNHVFRLNIFRVIITVSIIICFVFFGFIQAKYVRVDYAYQQIRYQCINVLNGFYVENKVICRCTRSIIIIVIIIIYGIQYNIHKQPTFLRCNEIIPSYQIRMEEKILKSD